MTKEKRTARTRGKTPARTQPKNQGEGDREAARRFNRDEQEFVQSKRGRDAIERERATDHDDSQELRDAELAARRRARENDPEEKRNYRKPAR
jgi:hypothetical protein